MPQLAHVYADMLDTHNLKFSPVFELFKDIIPPIGFLHHCADAKYRFDFCKYPEPSLRFGFDQILFF